MECKNNNNGTWLVKLERGDEVMSTLEAFFAAHNDGAAIIRGIGAIMDVEIGYFDVHASQYIRRTIKEDVELLSFMGNAVRVDGKPVVHGHVVISDRSFAAQGGHLFKAVIAITGEFFVQFTDIEVTRKLDPPTGLRLMTLA